MAYQQDLVHRGVRRYRDSHDPYADFDDNRAEPTALAGHYHSADEYYRHTRDPHPRSGNSRKIPRLRFEDALAYLFDTLNASLAFYSNFRSEFDNEVQGIAPYVGGELLDELWARRVKFTEDGRGARNPRDREAPRDRSQPPQDFTGTYRLLREKFELAIQAAQARRPQRPRHDDGRNVSIGRIEQKVRAGGKDIMELAKIARMRNSDVDPLMMELELLIAYLEKNKGVWHDGERGQDGRYYEGQGDGGADGQEACK